MAAEHHTQDAELLDRLEMLARAATPGPWVDGGHTVYQADEVGAEEICRRMDDVDSAYIAAVNPAAVLQLIELARRSIPQGDEPAEPYRAGFEAWARSQECLLTRTEAGNYADNETQTGWDAWLAAKREAAAQGDELPPLPEPDYTKASLQTAARIPYFSAHQMREYGAACRAGRAMGEDARDDADNLSVMLWLLRRLPRAYENPPHIVQAIERLAKRTGTDVSDSFNERKSGDAARNQTGG